MATKLISAINTIMRLVVQYHPAPSTQLCVLLDDFSATHSVHKLLLKSHACLRKLQVSHLLPVLDEAEQATHDGAIIAGVDQSYAKVHVHCGKGSDRVARCTVFGLADACCL